jgi:hypothetical protein
MILSPAKEGGGVSGNDLVFAQSAQELGGTIHGTFPLPELDNHP